MFFNMDPAHIVDDEVTWHTPEPPGPVFILVLKIWLQELSQMGVHNGLEEHIAAVLVSHGPLTHLAGAAGNIIDLLTKLATC